MATKFEPDYPCSPTNNESGLFFFFFFFIDSHSVCSSNTHTFSFILVHQDIIIYDFKYIVDCP